MGSDLRRVSKQPEGAMATHGAPVGAQHLLPEGLFHASAATVPMSLEGKGGSEWLRHDLGAWTKVT